MKNKRRNGKVGRPKSLPEKVKIGYSFTLLPEYAEWVRDVAEKEGTSMSIVVGRLIREAKAKHK